MCSHLYLRLLVTLAMTLPGIAVAESHLFRNGTLLTMTPSGAVEADLRVQDQRIAAIGQELAPAADDVVVDMRGGYLMPGLAEMHAHVPAPDQGRQYRDDVLFLWVANGITTARGMLGHPEHLELRRALATHQVLGPRLFTSGPSFNGDSVSSPSQARAMAREQAAAGYDFLKIHPGLTRAEYDAVADEARRLGLPFAGHVPEDVGLAHALEQGQATIDHLDGVFAYLAGAAEADAGLFGIGLAGRIDLGRLSTLADRLKAADAWLVPTETLLENLAAVDGVTALLERPETAYLPPPLRRRYREAVEQRGPGGVDPARALALRKEVLGRLHEAGVGVLLGSDSPQIFNVPGFSIHRELAAMVDAGLTPQDALLAGTVAPARFFGRSDDFGRLRVGLAADLVLLAEDPTADIDHTRSIRGVMVRGRWLDRAALDEQLQGIAARYAD